MGAKSVLRLFLLLALTCAVSCATPSTEPGPPINGQWSGRYVCAQGVTLVSLAIADRDARRESHDITATFSFSPAPENPGVASGSFAMRGFYYPQTRIVALWPLRWLEQPDDYEMVSLHGRMTRNMGEADVIRGRVEFPGDINACSTFTVTRTMPEVASRAGARV